jgi:2-polyprenyl-3-methyl-5-hydroxy-6-metoxy-1,4-benzoquinol methylase
VDPADYFDQLYRASKRYWWRDNPDRYSPDPNAYPSSLLTQMTLRLLQGRPQGRALDLGAGEGTDAIRLALLGYEVDAVEISPVAANKIGRFAAEAGTKVNAIVADVADLVPDTLYDVVISNGVLHYVKNKDSAIDRMQSATNIGGINVISLWSTYTSIPACHDFIPMFCDDEDGVVWERYAKWTKELIYFERDKKETAHSDLPPHSHSHIKMIARRAF